MYKTKLQLLCQQRKWGLPEYTWNKGGPDHNPRFSATVSVVGYPIFSTENHRNSKEAQNCAAKLAFEHISGPSPSADSAPTPPPSSPAPSAATVTDAMHLYKSRLQSYAQKKNIKLPEYSCEHEGPPHSRRFKCKVLFEGKSFEGQELFPTLKEAEHAAAKVAWDSLPLVDIQEDDALYKNLLQEFLQKKGCQVPKYETTSTGPSHMQVFFSTLNIQGHVFEGQAATTKKQAEAHAAKVAYFGLQDQQLNDEGIIVSSGQHMDTQLVFASGSEIKEALEASSSVLQAVIASELPKRGSPSASFQIFGEKSEEDSVYVKAGSGSHQTPSLGADKSPKRHRCSRSSDIIADSVKVSFPAASSPVNNVLASDSEDLVQTSLPAIGTYDLHREVGSIAGNSSTDGKIMVLRREPNMIIPDGATILSISDENWVAFQMNANQL